MHEYIIWCCVSYTIPMQTGVVLKDCYEIDKYFKKCTSFPLPLGFHGLGKNYPINAKNAVNQFYLDVAPRGIKVYWT